MKPPLLGANGPTIQRPPGTRFEPLPAFALASVRETGRVVRSGMDESRSANLPEDIRHEGIRSVVDAPILVEGRIWAAISVASWSGQLDPGIEQRIVGFTELIAMAIAKRRCVGGARAVACPDRRHCRRNPPTDRARLPRPCPAAAGFACARTTPCSANGAADLRALRDGIDEVVDGLTAVLDQLREISRGIHPAILSEGGLGPALRTLARRSAVPVERGGSRYSPTVEVAAYYIVSEALTNITKHANASQAGVVVREDDDTLRLRLSDDGVGGAQPDEGTGLTGLRDWVEALGGSIDVPSPAGHGTVLDVSLPIEPTSGATSTGASKVS